MPSTTDQNGNIAHHAISLEQLSILIAAELAELSDSGVTAARKAALQAIGKHVSTACLDDSFVAKHLRTRASGENVREILYKINVLGLYQRAG